MVDSKWSGISYVPSFYWRLYEEIYGRGVLAVTIKSVVIAYKEYTQGYSQPSNDHHNRGYLQLHDTASNTFNEGVSQPK